jgi:hypothetical protein
MNAPGTAALVRRTSRTTLATFALLVGALWLLSGCKESKTAASDAAHEDAASSTRLVQSGTRIAVTLGSDISSETASAGDAWHGTVAENVSLQDGESIPPGSEVEGVVAAVTAARRGSRAMLELHVRNIRVNGRNEAIGASAAPVIAGSTRKRNVGAVAGGALVGALIGKSVGDGRNAAVGGLVGGAATAGVVAGTKGYQVVLSNGTVMRFTVSRTVAMR